MFKRYVICNPEKNEYYTGKKNYEWTDYIFKAKTFKMSPPKSLLATISQISWLEIKTVYIPKK